MAKRTVKYVTSDGIELQLSSVPSRALEMVRAKVRLEFKKDGRLPDTPTRVVTAAGGDAYDVPLTEKSLTGKTESETADNTAKWEAYQEALNAELIEENAAVMNALLGMGVECEVPPAEEWFGDLEWMGILDKLPENPRDQKVAWLLYVALGDLDRDTVLGSLQALQMGGAVTAEQLDMFRRNIADTASRKAAGVFESVADLLADSELDSDEPVHGAEDGEGVEPDA